MSDPSSPSRRGLPSRLHAGSAVSGAIGLGLFVTPLVVFAQTLFAVAQASAVTGLELGFAILAVVLLNAIFVAGETAIELVRQGHLKQVQPDDRASAILHDVVGRKPLFVAACFLGSQTMRAWLILLTIPLAMSWAPSLRVALSLPEGWPSVMLAGFLIGIPAVAINVVLGELVPRTYASVDPVRTATRTYGFVRVFAAVFRPVTAVFMTVGSLLTRRFGAHASFSIANQAEEEIKERLEQAVETQEIEEEEKVMLHSVFEFGDTVAREIMTPRVDMDAVPVGTPLMEVAKLVEETGHSRIPVYEGTDDQIVGIVHAKDVLSAVARGDMDCPLRKLTRPAYFVPENKNLHGLLHEMRQARTQMVIVQDEFGGTAGVVTVEDIVEEVVGEIVDEYDHEEESIVRTDSGYRIWGKVNIDDLNEAIGSQFHSEEFDTIGGYVFGLFGRQPTEGESIEDEGYRFRVVETDGRRIVAVSVERVDEPEPNLQLDKAAEG